MIILVLIEYTLITNNSFLFKRLIVEDNIYFSIFILFKLNTTLLRLHVKEPNFITFKIISLYA